MLKATQHNLKKLETIYKESGFRVRYGKGNFQAGYCILDDQNQIVVNKFYSIEIKMGILTDLLTKVRIDKENLSEASLKAVAQQKVVLKELEPVAEASEAVEENNAEEQPDENNSDVDETDKAAELVIESKEEEQQAEERIEEQEAVGIITEEDLTIENKIEEVLVENSMEAQIEEKIEN